MKRIEFLWIVLVALFATTGCGGSSDDDPTPAPAAFSVAGEWRLVSWSTLSTADIYASFDEAGTFELYQRLYTPEYRYLHGTYTYAKSVLDGVYSDAVAWGSAYRVSFNSDGSQMTLTAERDAADVSVFARAAIPDEVRAIKSEASAQVQTKSGAVRFF
ncbi:MAG: hypothetical protein NC250_07740 [Alistipes senegalensis]|nr:hypothetical protein [Bacteroides cellulosilyticus]MCM1352607.1 hypothetical protein [Alistipes senegalensis]